MNYQLKPEANLRRVELFYKCRSCGNVLHREIIDTELTDEKIKTTYYLHLPQCQNPSCKSIGRADSNLPPAEVRQVE